MSPSETMTLERIETLLEETRDELAQHTRDDERRHGELLAEVRALADRLDDVDSTKERDLRDQLAVEVRRREVREAEDRAQRMTLETEARARATKRSEIIFAAIVGVVVSAVAGAIWFAVTHAGTVAVRTQQPVERAEVHMHGE